MCERESAYVYMRARACARVWGHNKRECVCAYERERERERERESLYAREHLNENEQRTKTTERK